MKRFFRKLFNWEKWPYDAIYAPLGLAWLYYGIRARSFWYFTPVNPSLIFAGFEGGSKKEVYDQLPAGYYPTTLLVDPANDFAELGNRMQEAGLKFPVVVKPDSGMQGVLFRVIHNPADLMQYHAKVGENYIVQTFVTLPMEFSVFYIRYPGEPRGKITGFILKDYLHVTGDGVHTLEQLVAASPGTSEKFDFHKRKHASNWTQVIQKDEKYILSFAGNHTHGARFINLHKEIDQRLHEVFDKLSSQVESFYFGRYDLKCTSTEDLKNGKNIQILEFNGAGAATTHIFDCNMSYWEALKEINRHWKDLYKIGRINYRKGVPYWSLLKGYRFLNKAKKNYKRMLAVDSTIK